jgi:GntR family transcriptional repressor for pyruvate dehydrogenase complex
MDDIVESQPARRMDRGRVADQILDDLRERILSGALPDGTRLPAEKDLAAQYGVSGATMREAVRALTAMGLISSKHGSGSSVTAHGDTLVGLSLESVARLEKMGPADVLGILGALLGYAAELAAREASTEDLAALRETAEAAVPVTSVAQAAEGLRLYLRTLAEISHNPLLATLCRFLIDLQIDWALERSAGVLDTWKRMVGERHTERMNIVDALDDRSPERAPQLTRGYVERSLALIQSFGNGTAGQAPDPVLSRLLRTWTAGKAIPENARR